MDRMEEFFFDIFGLFLPGLLFVLMIYFLLICNIDIDHTKNMLNFTYNYTLKFNGLKIPDYMTALLALFLLYLVGHVVKVMSKYLYDICAILMDEILLKPVKKLNQVTTNLKSKFSFLNAIFKLIKKILAIILEIFSFKVESYSASFKEMISESRDQLHSKYNMEFYQENTDWYPFYKSALIIAEEAKLKTHSRFFLAKYNFYRSIASIFIIHLSLMLIYHKNPNTINTKYFMPILALDFLCWITFHVKYKRYWMQCGNEAIIGLYHSIFKIETETSKNNH